MGNCFWLQNIWLGYSNGRQHIVMRNNFNGYLLVAQKTNGKKWYFIKYSKVKRNHKKKKLRKEIYICTRKNYPKKITLDYKINLIPKYYLKYIMLYNYF